MFFERENVYMRINRTRNFFLKIKNAFWNGDKHEKNYGIVFFVVIQGDRRKHTCDCSRGFIFLNKNFTRKYNHASL